MDAGEDILAMKSHELERYQIIRKVFDNQINIGVYRCQSSTFDNVTLL